MWQASLWRMTAVRNRDLVWQRQSRAAGVGERLWTTFTEDCVIRYVDIFVVWSVKPFVCCQMLRYCTETCIWRWNTDISFHSLEDRLNRNMLAQHAFTDSNLLGWKTSLQSPVQQFPLLQCVWRDNITTLDAEKSSRWIISWIIRQIIGRIIRSCRRESARNIAHIAIVDDCCPWNRLPQKSPKIRISSCREGNWLPTSPFCDAAETGDSTVTTSLKQYCLLICYLICYRVNIEGLLMCRHL